MNIITGEKIQNKCDYYIGNQYDFNFNPNIKKQQHKFIYLNNINMNIITKPVIIFTYTHVVENNMNSLLSILKNFSNIISLVCHNSDGKFTQKHYDILKNIVPIIYSQNIICNLQENLNILPIGMANSQWKHGNITTMTQVIESNILQNNYIYFNFNINTNIQKRKICYDKITALQIANLPNLPYKQYLSCLKSYKYAICPEGNGSDTHRFWECLYLKVIPICLKNTITQYYATKFPIVLLEDWNDILNHDKITIVKNWDNYYLLNMDLIFN